MNDPQQSSNNDALGEDPMLDALLAEVFGKATPPDLSSSIMRRLHETPVHTRSTVASSRVAGSVGSQSDTPNKAGTVTAEKQSNWLIQFTLTVAALAASFGFVIVAWNVYQPKKLEYSTAATTVKPIESTPKNTSVAKIPAVEPTETPTQSPRPQRPEPRGITIASDDKNKSQASPQAADTQSPLRRPQRREVEPVQLVSTKANHGLANYWNAVGVQPSDPAKGEEIQLRLKARLQVELKPAWFGSASGINPASEEPGSEENATDEIEAALRNENNANNVAFAWLQQITGGSIQQLPEDQRQVLVTELASAFQGQQAFDTLIASWLRGDSDAGSAWYAAVTRGGEFATAHRLASLTMNIDLRCTRCHDALIESDGRQHEYWSFASVLRRDLTRAENGRWSVRSEELDTKLSPVFYERLDGRQTMAEPRVPASWLVREPSSDPSSTLASQPEVTTVRQWSDAIIGSRSLARGVVNSLWRLVHDRPLRGVVADASSPPLDDALVQLEEMLVNDFVEANFDASRLLAIILSSPATSRSIPETLVRQDAWALDAGKVRLAEQAVEAFAATAPSPKLLPLGKRVDISMRSIGATLKSVDSIGSVLAQPLEKETGGKDKQPRESSPTASGFPDHADGFPVQWLASVDSFGSQVKHLGYLAAAEQLPPAVEAVSEAMQKANVAPELTLHRVWWLLQP